MNVENCCDCFSSIKITVNVFFISWDSLKKLKRYIQLSILNHDSLKLHFVQSNSVVNERFNRNKRQIFSKPSIGQKA